MKYALITGASGGIGSAVAHRLAEEGYSLYLHYHQNERAASILQESLSSYAIDVKLIQADLTAHNGAEVLWEGVEHELQAIVYTAGRSIFGLVTDVTNEQLEQLTHLQITNLYKLVNFALPAMIRNRTGSIVVVSSIWGQTGASCEVLYSMLKGAQNTYVKALAKEVALSGIRVNAVAPGAVATEMLSMFSKDELQSLEEEIPMGRLGKPEEIAQTISFLLSSQASYITGQIIAINGGWYC